MKNWMSRRAAGALLLGFLAGGFVATGAAGFATGDAPEQSQTADGSGCSAVGAQDTGERISFGSLRPHAL